MNGDALSDLLLAAVALTLAWRLASRRPGIAIAMAVIGVAAACGVLRYLGVEEALGPHRFFSLVAACAGLPLLAASVCWPETPLARRAAAGARFVVLVGGIGVVIVVILNVALWSDAAAAISALSLMTFALQRRKLIAIAASLALIAGFAVSVSGVALGPFNALQGFHILLILSLSLMGWEEQVKGQ